MYDIYRQEVKDMQEYRNLQERTNEDLVIEYQSKHIEELKRKYGGDEDPEYSDLDRKLIAKMKQ